MDTPGCCCFLLPRKVTNESSFVNLTKANGFYFITLRELIHKLHTKTTIIAQKLPPSACLQVDCLLMESCFHLDFGFICSSSKDFGQTKTGNCVVTSYDGHNTFLLLICVQKWYTFIFCQPSKAHKYWSSLLSCTTLTLWYHALHLEQGRDLWLLWAMLCFLLTTYGNLPALNQIVIKARPSALIPTLCCLVLVFLPSSGLLLFYMQWFLEKDLWHSAMECKQFEALTGTKPEISHLRDFGAFFTTIKQWL